MSEVVTFLHRGVRTAIPGGQATHLERAKGDEAREVLLARGAARFDVALWEGPDLSESYWLCVQIPGGSAWLRCDRVQLSAIERSEMLALSTVLREAMRGLPHVVGSAWTAEGHAWLVDLSRLGQGA